MKLFILLVLGAAAGIVAIAAKLVFEMIFWANTSIDLSALVMNSVCGAAAGMIVVTLIALVHNVFGNTE